MPSSPKFHGRSNQSPPHHKSELLVVAACLLVGISGFAVGLVSVLRPIACSRPPKPVRVPWERSGGAAMGKRHKVIGFVGIFTGFGSAGRRRSLRWTWLPSDPQGNQRLEEATGLAFRFMIGRTKSKSKMSALKREVAVYDDFVLLDIEEEYSKLPYKTLAFFKAAYALYDAEFYVKADDDIYLRPDRLSLLLAKNRSHSQTYIGCMKKGVVFTDPTLKWYEPLSDMLGKQYFLHAYGPLYALSADVVASLVALKSDSFRMFSNEDVTIGAWMLAMNVDYENNKALCKPECTPSYIAVWDIPKCSGLCNPEKRLLELHQNKRCSESTTQESDD